MKKFISICVSICLLVSAFAGCSKNNSDNQTDELTVTFDSHYVGYDSSAVSAYENLCKAIMTGEREVKYNIRMLDQVNQLYYTSFPLNALVESVDILSDSSGVEIKYKNDLETHLKLVEDFNNKVNEILDACSYDSVNSSRFVFNVYSYITQNFTVDNNIVSVYDVIMQGKGVKSAINSAFEYLVLIAGGKASHAVNIDGSANMISIANFNNDWYYFDAASEIENNGGKALRYFAMNDRRTGSYINGQFKYTDGTVIGTVTDNKYDKLENSDSYDAKSNEISVVLSDGGNYMLELN